jgi:hypothetical protein
MLASFSRSLRAVVFPVASLLLFCCAAQAQQHKGDKEILVFTGGFFISVDEQNPNKPPLTGVTQNATVSGVRNLNLGVKLGYFLTQRNEVGAGTSLVASRSRFCIRTFADGQLTSESCNTNTYFAMSLGVFYRYHFAREGDRKFFFVGADLSASDVTRNYTGNIRLRPHVGYRYFVEKIVALDFSVGYSAEVNKKDMQFPREREGSIDGQLSLSFVF